MLRLVLAVLFCSLLIGSSLAGTTQNRPPATNTQKGSAVSAAFRNAGKQKGLEIWRIENFEPVSYPQNNFGKFYTGDSFIVLNTKQDNKGKLSWDIHFWLGSDTSQDEAGAAAIHSVQLDDSLGGEPVQHREVQEQESPLFKGYFPTGLRYEAGGVGTGFRHVETNAAGAKRLFIVKGKRNVRVKQVNLSISSMNKGDCFILDSGRDVYVWVGKGATRVEKLKATSVANQIRDEDHHGRATVQIVDEFSPEIDHQNFFTLLGSGAANQVPEASTAEEDNAFEQAEANRAKLYKVSDASGSLKVEPITQKPIKQEMLKSDDCFILDTGSCIYVWVGRKATKQEKDQVMSKGKALVTTNKYPNWTEVERIIENAETAPFKQYFATWRDVGQSHTRLI